MRFLLLISLLVTPLFARETSALPFGKIKGVLIVSLTELESFEFDSKDAKGCTSNFGGTFTAIHCQLENTEAVFSNAKSGMAKVTFTKGVSFVYSDVAENGLVAQHIYRGTWKLQHNGIEVDLPVALTLNAYKNKANLFSGYLDVDGTSRRYVQARLE